MTIEVLLLDWLWKFVQVSVCPYSRDQRWGERFDMKWEDKHTFLVKPKEQIYYFEPHEILKYWRLLKRLYPVFNKKNL